MLLLLLLLLLLLQQPAGKGAQCMVLEPLCVLCSRLHAPSVESKVCVHW